MSKNTTLCLAIIYSKEPKICVAEMTTQTTTTTIPQTKWKNTAILQWNCRIGRPNYEELKTHAWVQPKHSLQEIPLKIKKAITTTSKDMTYNKINTSIVDKRPRHGLSILVKKQPHTKYSYWIQDYKPL